MKYAVRKSITELRRNEWSPKKWKTYLAPVRMSAQGKSDIAGHKFVELIGVVREKDG